MRAQDALDGLRPERLFHGGGPVTREGAVAPRPPEYVRQDEHRHVAPHAVAALGNTRKLAPHRFPEPAVPIVQLESIGPTREVGVAAAGEDPLARAGRADPVGRLAREVRLRPRDEVLGVGGHPGVVRADVIRHEVEEEPEPTPREPLTQPREGVVAAVLGRDVVRLDRERRAGAVLVAEVGQIAHEPGAPVLPGAGDRAGGGPSGPDSEEPDPLEAARRDVVERGVREVVQIGRAPERAAPLAEQDARVHLVEEGPVGPDIIAHGRLARRRGGGRAPPRARSTRSGGSRRSRVPCRRGSTR